MKRLLSTLLLTAAMVIPAVAKDIYSHDLSILPTPARTAIESHFKGKDVSHIKIEKDFGRVSEYEVTMIDGCEISFNSKGNWKNVESSGRGQVPASFIPKAIAAHLAKTHPGVRVVGIDHDRKGYEVELSSGQELKYDNQGKFLRYDD